MFKRALPFVFVSCALQAQTAPAAPAPVHLNLAEAEAKSFWKYHHWAAIGYRRDREDFSEGASKTSYTDRNSVELILGSHIEWHRVVAYLRGSYGWLASGNAHLDTYGTRFNQPLSFGQFNLGAGYDADAMAVVGFRLDLYDRPSFGFSFIPSGGYKYSHMMNFPQGESRTTLLNGTGNYAIAHFSRPNQQDWFGPLAEGRIEFRLWEVLEWSFFYQYFWLDVRSKTKEAIDLYLYNGSGAATAVNRYRASSIYKENMLQKQLIGADIRYRTISGWNMGVHFEASVADTNHAQAITNVKEEQALTANVIRTSATYAQGASIHWVCYEASISLGYQF